MIRASAPQRLRGQRRLIVAVGTLAAIGLVGPATVPAQATTVRAPATPIPEDDWPSFHHDKAHSGFSTDTQLGAATAPNLHVRWKTYPGGGDNDRGSVQTSPAVVYNTALAKNIAYIGSSQVPGAMAAMDAKTGEKLWSFTIPAPIFSSPAVSGGVVYFGGTDGNLYALDAATGQLICSYNVGGKIIASPVVADVDGSGPVVFFGDAGTSEKINKGNEWAVNGVGNTAGQCTLKWSFNGWLHKGGRQDKAGSWSPPALATDVTGRPLLVAGSSDPDDAVYAWDARDGSQVWRFQTLKTGADMDVGAGPAISAPGVNGFADGVVYILGKDRIEYAIDLLTGTEVWKFDMSPDVSVDANGVSTAAVVGNRVIVGYSLYVYSLDAVTGAKIWRTTMNGIVVSSPAVVGVPGDEVVFSGDNAGVMHALRFSDGVQLFQQATRPRARIQSSAAISSGRVFFGCSDGRLYNLGHAS